MLAQFRSFAKTPAAKIMLVAVGAGFLFVGGRTIVGGGALQDSVVSAGGRSVSSSQFRTLFERYRNQLAQQQQQQQPGAPAPAPLSVEDAVKQGLDARALDEIAFEESLAALIARDGVRPSDRLITDELRKAPTLFDALTGKFDKAAYEKFLAQNNLTAAEFERGLRDQIAQQHTFTGLIAGLQAPAAYGAMQALFNHEGRRFELIELAPTSVPQPAPPSEAQLQAFMRDNAKALMRPETRQVTLVRFSASQLAPTVAIDPAAVKKRFDFEKDALSTPEKRSFVQIPLKNAAEAAGVVAKLRTGGDPVAVARSVGAQPVVYGDTAREAVPDAGIAAAAFAMSAGEVRGPVAGGLGPAVIRVSSITPGHAATIDEARPKLEAEVRKDAAGRAANAAMQKYEDARSGGASLVDAAKSAGVAAVPVPPFDAQGRTRDGRTLPVPRKLVETALTLAPGGDSPVLEAGQGQGEFYAIHLDAVNPPSPLTLEEIRAPLSQRLTMQALAKTLKAKADALATELRAGRPTAEVAKSAGATVVTTAVRRDDTQATQTYGREFVGELFEAKPGAVVIGAGAKGSALVAKLGAPLPSDPVEVARLSQTARRGVSSGLYEDLAVHARDAARAIISPRVDLSRARRALGVAAPSSPQS